MTITTTSTAAPAEKRTQTRHSLRHSKAARLGFAALAGGILSLGSQLHADAISIPNFSFESQTAPGSYPFVNTFVDSWQKAAEPAYYGPAIGTPFGIPWQGTAGVFLDVNPYLNHVGTQAGYLLAFPQVELFQDYTTSPTHDFNATFDVGKSYKFTIGVFGKNTLAPGSTLQLGLYYLDGGSNKVLVSTTTATYSAAAFPTSPLNLIDYEVNVPAVQAGDAWAGKNIGIQLLSTSPIELATGGNWDFDNARLASTVVPEPASLGLLAIGLGGLLARRSHSSRRA